MKECWSEGDLRAYLDRELPSEEMGRVAEHLEVCSECGDLWAELAGRAARVSALMEALPDPDRTISISRTPRRTKGFTWRWAGPAAALAAGLVLGIIELPKRPAAPAGLPPVSWAAPQAAQSAPPSLAQPAAMAPMRVLNAAARPGRVQPQQPKRNRLPDARSSEDFISLDDEPISTGVVMRVELGPKGIPADVIFGSDGRPHAIRLANNQSKH